MKKAKLFGLSAVALSAGLLLGACGSGSDSTDSTGGNSGSKTANINIKNCKALLKKVVIGRAVTAIKQQNTKGKGEEKGIAEIVHLMKPITRSSDSGQPTAI